MSFVVIGRCFRLHRHALLHAVAQVYQLHSSHRLSAQCNCRCEGTECGSVATWSAEGERVRCVFCIVFIQSYTCVRMRASAHEFKLNGSPWSTCGEEAVQACILITKLLQCLLANGLAVVCALDISHNADDKGSIVFSCRSTDLRSGVFVIRTCTPANIPHFCVAPIDCSKIRLLHAPSDIVDIFRQTVTEV